MDAAGILGIGEGEAVRLFPGPEDTIRKTFRKLAREWHPDLCADPGAAEVFAHIVRLHDIALGRVRPGAHGNPNARTWKLADGGEMNVTPRAVHRGDVGDVLVTESTVAFETAAGFEDVAEAELAAVSSFRFASDAMREGMKHFLPRHARRIDAIGLTVNIYGRPRDTMLLADLKAALGGRIPPVHVAWIVSSLENMACYLDWLGVAHGAISPENVLVSPSMHSVILVGGWGFSTPFGSRPRILPQRTLSLIPRMAAKGQTVDRTVDTALVRATAIDLLGARGAAALASDGAVPDAMRTWLSLPPGGDARADYRSWERCLTESFGPRKFVKLEVNPAQVYGPA